LSRPDVGAIASKYASTGDAVVNLDVKIEDDFLDCLFYSLLGGTVTIVTRHVVVEGDVVKYQQK